MTQNLQSTKKLRDGNEIPIVGFGTYQMEGKTAYNAVTWALESGYRHIDSAEWYYNERECGNAIRDFLAKHDLPRSAVFFTTKLQNNGSYARAKAGIDKSLKACGLEYIDLYLLHSPIGGPQKRRESWKAVCDAKKEGKIRSVGVSNFGVKHLKEMIRDGVELPVLNQIELHPFNTHADIVEFCQEHDIVLEAWAPLVRGERFDHPSIVGLAKKYGKQPAQILVRYSIQKGFVTLPKSQSKQRIQSNVQVFDFELTDEEVKHLDGLNEDLVTDWDPTGCP
ncbi:aldo-keto reductase [Panus rudis PR-1116 ss-1]|nr:aldo-keto reductase [Panus rudis PR-1116 ss-1]